MEVTGAAQERQGEGQAVDHVPPPCFQRTCLLFCRSCSLRLYELQGFVFCFVCFLKFSLKKNNNIYLLPDLQHRSSCVMETLLSDSMG